MEYTIKKIVKCLFLPYYLVIDNINYYVKGLCHKECKSIVFMLKRVEFWPARLIENRNLRDATRLAS